MTLPDRAKGDEEQGSDSQNVAFHLHRSAKAMRKNSLIAYANSFSDPSIIDPKTAPKLSYRQRLYLRAYDKLFQMFMEDYTELSKIKERREREGIGFLFALPDPNAVREIFLKKMRGIVGEGNYDGYERALEYEQKQRGHRSHEGLIVGNEEEVL
jgi:hypothetical protein